MALKRVICAGFAAAVSVVLAGCPSSGVPRLGDPLVLAVGDTTTIPDLNLWLRFRQVAFDSRCPSQSLSCPSLGDAAVVIEIVPFLGESSIDTLHTTLDPQSATVGLVEVRLARLDPYPVTAGSIPTRDYRATLITQEVPTN